MKKLLLITLTILTLLFISCSKESPDNQPQPIIVENNNNNEIPDIKLELIDITWWDCQSYCDTTIYRFNNDCEYDLININWIGGYSYNVNSGNIGMRYMDLTLDSTVNDYLYYTTKQYGCSLFGDVYYGSLIISPIQSGSVPFNDIFLVGYLLPSGIGDDIFNQNQGSSGLLISNTSNIFEMEISNRYVKYRKL